MFYKYLGQKKCLFKIITVLLKYQNGLVLYEEGDENNASFCADLNLCLIKNDNFMCFVNIDYMKLNVLCYINIQQIW